MLSGFVMRRLSTRHQFYYIGIEHTYEVIWCGILAEIYWVIPSPNPFVKSIMVKCCFVVFLDTFVRWVTIHNITLLEFVVPIIH